MTAPPPNTPPKLPSGWPHAEHSRWVMAGGQVWHMQDMGAGPAVLLIHGAGGSLHCWRGLAPLLAAQFRVIALDIAGHGYSVKGRFAQAGLDDVAQGIADLAAHQAFDIQFAIGHSAGAAVALRLSQIMPLRAVAGLNPALSLFEGVAGWLFPALAKTLSVLPFAPLAISTLLGSASQIDQLLAQTGAQIDAQGRSQYLHLVRRPAHVAATLAMMAAWDLRPLLQSLPQINVPTLLLTGQNDRAVPPQTAVLAAQRMPAAKSQILPRYGHLLPEEAAQEIAPILSAFLASNG